MFSGIIAGVCKVGELKKSDSGVLLSIEMDSKLAAGLERGASVSVNGVCLTVVDISKNTDASLQIRFDVVPETLAKTNLSELGNGSLVNVERALKFGEEVGGHLCSGHVDGVVTVTAIVNLGHGAEIDFEVQSELLKFVLKKGFIALNGASLTVAAILPTGFRVAFIPETLSNTNLGYLVVGTKVNLEIDRSTQAVVETVERVLETMDRKKSK